MSTTLDFIERFYEARQAGNVHELHHFLAKDVRWIEPTVGDHMGELYGRDSVLDMIGRALSTTGGTFSLRVAQGIEVAGHCSVVINWSASKSGETITGRELAIFSVVNNQIVYAQFLPENIEHDDAFWA